MGKRGRPPHPDLSSGKNLRSLLRRHGWYVPDAAEEIQRSGAAVYLALKAHGVRIPEWASARIRERSARHAAEARWKK